MNQSLTVAELVAQINCFTGKTPVVYPSGKTLVRVVRVQLPEGPIVIQRQPADNFKSWNLIPEQTISTNMLWRYTNALNMRVPVHVDRVLGASYNTRSALEALVAACPNFFMCRPRRITNIGSQKIISDNSHKYLIWNPDKAHEFGLHAWDETVNGFITELPSSDVYFDAVNTDTTPHQRQEPISPELKRIHSQMQVLLSKSAHWMDLRSWIAVEDHGIVTEGKNILSYPYIVGDLKEERVINNYPDAMDVAKHVDCIWFNGGMPFAFEVEHTTGVTSGLCRMQKLQENAPHCNTNYVIVAPDDDRQQVIKKSQSSQFSEMNLWYMPYSSLIELSEFASKHQYRCGNNGKSKFAKMFMEQINEAY